MATYPVGYNPSQTPISGTTQVGDLVIGDITYEYSLDPGGVEFWMSPDDSVGYLIAHPTPAGNQPNPLFTSAYVGFWRTIGLTELSFIELSEWVSTYHGTPQIFASGFAAKTWLNNNGYWTSYIVATPTPTPTNTVTPTQTPTPSFTPTQSVTPTNTLTQTQTPTQTPTPTNTQTPTKTPTQTPTKTPTPSSTPLSALAVHFDISNSSSYPGSGSVITDLSGKGNNGTLNGDYAYSALNSGTMSMGGTNSYVNVPQSASINIANTSTPVSIVMWINITAGYSNGDGIWNKNMDAGSYDGYRLIAQSNNQVRLGINGQSFDYNLSSASNAIATGTWMMLTTIVQGGTSYVYRDNNSTAIVQGTTNAQPIPVNTANLQLCVGEFNTLGGYLPCRWGQFRYYKNKSLSTAEISTLFDADKAKYGL